MNKTDNTEISLSSETEALRLDDTAFEKESGGADLRPRAFAIAQLAVIAFFVALEGCMVFKRGLEGLHFTLLALWIVCGFFAVRSLFRVFGKSPAVSEDEPELPDYSQWDVPPPVEPTGRDIWAELGISPATVDSRRAPDEE